MSSKFPAFYPITKVYIVSDPQKCSANDELLLRSKDKDADCDLLKEGGMFKKSTRYLCFSRAFNKDAHDSRVLVSMQLISERESPPPGFITIEKTTDSGEKATKKKTLCVKMVDRASVKDAICDIKLFTKVKRPEAGYTAVGDLNGVFICTKSHPVPLDTQAFKHSSNTQANTSVFRQAPPPPHKTAPQPVSRAKSDYGTLNPLSNIDFKLTSSSELQQDAPNKTFKPSISFRSLNDIENEFQYNFKLERSVLCK